MEGTKDMTSNTSNSTAAASAPHNHQQEEAVVVPPPTAKEQAARDTTKPRPQQEVALECPRCCSKNTKFCYYNNYNLDQPRHFCKNCRRYWTQGGTLRVIPIGSGSRRNKCASSSSSSSAASSTAATNTKMENTVKTQLMLTAASMPHSPMTGLVPTDMLPVFTLTGGSGSFVAAMDDQQGFLPFAPLSFSDDQAPELAPGEGSDTTPTFLDTLTRGYFHAGAGNSSFCYDGGLSMGGGSNGMDMSCLLPGMWPSATDPMQTQLLERIDDDVAGELQWTSAELDSYFNNDGVEQQQQVVLVGDQQEDDNNKPKGAEG